MRKLLFKPHTRDKEGSLHSCQRVRSSRRPKKTDEAAGEVPGDLEDIERETFSNLEKFSGAQSRQSLWYEHSFDSLDTAGLWVSE